MSEIDEIIESGMVFRGAPKPKVDDGKVKTKAKKKKYITGAHGSGSAKHKYCVVADISALLAVDFYIFYKIRRI